MDRCLIVLLAAIAFASASPPLAARASVAPADRGVAADVASARNLRDLGRMNSNAAVNVGVLMRVRNVTELQQLTLLQGRPGSPVFHHYLSPAQWNAYFAPDAQTYARTAALLQRRGFHILRTFSNRGYLEARAPASTVERYFSTKLRLVEQPGRGVRYMNVTPAVMPAELRDVAVSVAGLHSIVTVSHPIRFADKTAFRRSELYAQTVAALRAPAPEAAGGRDHPLNVPTPLTATTPSVPQPGPDPTEVPGNPTSDLTSSAGGYDPTIYATAYDYPVQHGYGGSGHNAGTVIEADYLDSDAKAEFTNFGIPRSPTAGALGYGVRLCADPNPTANCDGTIGAADPEGESTLDAMVIMSMAPKAGFYEAIAPAFNDEQIEAAYEVHINMDVVDDVNSSFGECETDDPAFGYATNYLAMEGAALGISFEASTGDTGATACGTYITNGAVQTEFNTSLPSSGVYFTAIGGTQFAPLTSCTSVGSGCYTSELAWNSGNGGYSAIEPVPSWQLPALSEDGQTLTSVGSTTMRNTPDVAFTAALAPGMDIYYNGSQSAIGGTSVGSPCWTALQVEINQVQKSRNGWVNPGLYAAFLATNTTTVNFAFRDITGGNNGKYTAVPGYDDASGLGSPLGWELAGVENGTPVTLPASAARR